MRIQFILTLFLGISVAGLSQPYTTNHKTAVTEYTVINNDYDIVNVNGPVAPDLWNGFEIFNENGEGLDSFISPNDYKYIIYKDANDSVITLKSFLIQDNSVSYKVFMHALIENSEEDLKTGKIDLYLYQYSDMTERNENVHENIQHGYFTVHHTNYYIKDMNGLHRIDYKNQFKEFPTVLGLSTYKAMKRSNDKKQFLYNHLTQYNQKISLKSSNSNTQ